MSAVLAIAAVTIIAAPFHDQLDNTTVVLALALVVFFVATMWGRGPGMLPSLLGMLCFNFFLTASLHLYHHRSAKLDRPTAFVVIALIAGHLRSRQNAALRRQR